jgi:hypothetical protein
VANVKAQAVLLVVLSLSVAQLGVAQTSSIDREAERLRGDDTWETDFSIASVPLSEIVGGGPPKDGIPAIERPRFVSIREADKWLFEKDPLLVVEIDGQVKGYPIGILIWHEIVNDQLAGVPIVVTFCPLCNAALVFDGRLGDRVLDFGTTGRLRQSDMVMYDRQTESWWQQAVGEAIVGFLTGEVLEMIPANTLGWDRARNLYPGMQVLSRETGYPGFTTSGRYGQNPYERYDSRNGPFRRFYQGRLTADLPAMDRVAAVDHGKGWAARFEDIKDRGAANGTVEDLAFVIFWADGAASALDKTRIAAGRDIGQTASYSRVVDGRELTFEAIGDGQYRDQETATTWDLAGRALDGPLLGKQLEGIPHGNHFWFAWTAFRPESAIWP